MIAYGIFSSSDNHMPRLGARVGNDVVDLLALSKTVALDEDDCFAAATLNDFIRKGYHFRQEVKQAVNDTLEAAIREPHSKLAKTIFALNQIKLHMPVSIGGYTDFYASRQHATNIGKIFRPDNPLMPNWVHMPIAYNGRASSVAISNHPVKRPRGQILIDGKPEFHHCRKLDFEVELGIIIGKDNPLGEPIDINKAHEHIFGVCLVNDWSARDIQAWEYQPLGPFTSKSFLTAISAFIIPIEEFEVYKVPALQQEPKPLQYLQQINASTFDIKLNVVLKTKKYPQGMVISQTNFRDIYWTMSQWIAHHTVTGCNLQVGDLLASGTISGDSDTSFGSLMELTVNGKEPITLPNGEVRTFLEDGDSIEISGYCGEELIGEVLGTIVC